MSNNPSPMKLIKWIHLKKPPEPFWHEDALQFQTALRWTIMLQKESFKLPGFDHVYIMIVETISAPAERIIQDVSSNNGPLFRDIHCQIRTRPNSAETALELINHCIYESLQLISDHQPSSLEILSKVYKLIQTEGTALKLVLRSKSNKSLSIVLSIRPGGLHPAGGEFLLSIHDKINNNIVERKLFDYCSYFEIVALAGTISGDNKILKIIAGKRWTAIFPKAPREIQISIPEFMAGVDISLAFLSDISIIKESLMDHDLPW